MFSSSILQITAQVNPEKENSRVNNEITGTESWEQIPGPFGGIIQSLAYAEKNMYAGTIGGGLYKSSNYGDTWLFIGANCPFLDIQKILFNNGRLFIVNRNYGVYYSEDDGLSWSEANSGLKNTQVTSIVEINGTLFCSTYGNGIYISTNNGTSWTEKNNGLNNKFVNQLIAYGEGLYAATNLGAYSSGNYGESWSSIRSSGSFMHITVNNNYIFIATNFQVMMTSNNGYEWDQAGYGYGLGTGTIYSLYSTGPYVIAGRSDGVFVSTFVGGEWVNVYSTLKTIRVYSLLKINDFLYSGTSKGVFYSQDFGGKWKESNKGLLNERILSFFFDKNIIYAGLLDNGVIISTDFGNSWTDMGLGYKRVSMVYKEQSGLWVFANDTLLFTSNNGITWEYRHYGLEGQKLNSFVKYGNDYYIGTDDGLFYTRNNGLSWNPRTEELRRKKIRSIFIDKDNYVYLATADKIFISRDNMATWFTSSEGMKSYDITCLTGNEDYMIAGSQPDILFDAEIYVSYDGARNWIATDYQWRDMYVHDIAMIGVTAFVSVRNTGTDESMGILYSSNSGRNWQEFNEGLRVKDIRDMVIRNNTLYIASFGSSLLKREIPEPLATLILSEPKNNAKNVFVQPRLKWEAVEGAEIYNIDIADNLINYDKHIIAQYSSTITQFDVPEGILKNSSTYYWRVNYLKNNRISNWSEIFGFTTEAEQNTITNLLAPANNSTDVEVFTNFEWEPLSIASEYIIQVSESNDFVTKLIDVAVVGSSYTAHKGNLDFNKAYFWKVRAVINDAEREWSETFSFTTKQIALTEPELVYPLDNSKEVPLTSFFEWNAVGDADEYILFISDDIQFSKTIFLDTISTTILNIKSGVLDWETEYYWKVKAKFLDYESAWSPVRKFKTATEVSVKDNSILANINFNIAPNPASRLIEINISLPFQGEVKINISDLNGNRLVEKVFYYNDISSIETFKINMENYSDGIYNVILETKYGIVTKKIIIIH